MAIIQGTLVVNLYYIMHVKIIVNFHLL